jgi:hypothetical protein
MRRYTRIGQQNGTAVMLPQRKELTWRNLSLYLAIFSMELLVSKIKQHIRRTFVLNDSRPGGILPITPTFDNWTRVEAIQQGLTAEVNCTATSDSDPYIRINQTTVAPGIFEVTLCCNCTFVSTNSTG